MKKHIFRAAAALSLLAGMTTLSSCGSGLLDTEDKDLVPSFSVTLDSASATKLDNVNYGDVVDLDVTVTLTNANFSTAFKAVVDDETPTSNTPFDLLEDGYFTVQLLSANGTNLIAESEETEEDAVSFAATSSVTQSKWTTSGANYVPASATFKAHLTMEVDDGTATQTARLVVRSTSATGKGGLSSSLSCNLSKADAAWGISLPSAGEIIAASKKAETGKTVGTTMLSLEGRVKKSIAAGDVIGTATLGGSSVTVKALSAVAKKARQIPVLLVSDGAFGEGTISLDSQYADATGKAVSADEASSCIAVPYYGEDFDSYTSSSTEYSQYINSKSELTNYEHRLSGTTSSGETVKLIWATWLEPELKSGAIVHNGTSQSGPRGMFTYDGDHLWTDNEDGLVYTDGQKYAVEFDVTVGEGSDLYVYNKEVVAVQTPNETSSTGIDTLDGIYIGNTYTGETYVEEIGNYVWGISTTAGTYHVKLVIDYNATAGESTITPYLNGEAGEAVHDVGGGDAQGITINTVRGTSTTLDNIVVYGLGK